MGNVDRLARRRSDRPASRRTLVQVEALEGRSLLTSTGGGYSFEQIDYPNASSTSLGGINNSGQVVGEFANAEGTASVFSFSNSKFTLLTNPNTYDRNGYLNIGQLLTANGINDSGQIVGSDLVWGLQTGVSQGSYLKTGNIVTSFSYQSPNTIYTRANDVNNESQVVGTYLVNWEQLFGFLYSDGKLTTISFPGAWSTGVEGINDAGQIVGYYADDDSVFGPYHGFLLSDGKYTTIDAPDSAETQLTGINDSGQIVGVATNFEDDENGFLLNAGQFIQISDPSADETLPFDINNKGQISGDIYTNIDGDNNTTGLHGFIASAQPPAFTASAGLWNAAQGGAGFTADVSWPGLTAGQSVPAPVGYNFYWSSTSDLSGQIGKGLLPTDATLTKAGATPVSVAPKNLGDPPIGAKYLVLTIDPSDKVAGADRSHASLGLPVSDALGSITATVNGSETPGVVGRFFAVPGVPGVDDDRFEVELPESLAAARPDVSFDVGGMVIEAGPQLVEGSAEAVVQKDGGVVYVADDPYDPGKLDGSTGVSADVDSSNGGDVAFASQDGTIDVRPVPDWLKALGSLVVGQTGAGPTFSYSFTGLLYDLNPGAVGSIETPGDLPFSFLDHLQNTFDFHIKVTLLAPLDGTRTPTIDASFQTEVTLLGQALVDEGDSPSIGLDQGLSPETLRTLSGGAFGVELYDAFSTDQAPIHNLSGTINKSGVFPVGTVPVSYEILLGASLGATVTAEAHVTFDPGHGFQLVAAGTNVDIEGRASVTASVKAGVFVPTSIGIAAVDREVDAVLEVAKRDGKSPARSFTLGAAVGASLAGSATVALGFGFDKGSEAWTKAAFSFDDLHFDTFISVFSLNVTISTIDLLTQDPDQNDLADALTGFFPGLKLKSKYINNFLNPPRP